MLGQLAKYGLHSGWSGEHYNYMVLQSLRREQLFASLVIRSFGDSKPRAVNVFQEKGSHGLWRLNRSVPKPVGGGCIYQFGGREAFVDSASLLPTRAL